MQNKATTVYLVRHGQTDWNVEKKIQGQLDIPLNEKGKVEAAQLAGEFADIDFSACYSSDLQRAFETASILNKQRYLSIGTDKRLRERSFGNWEGNLSFKYHAASMEHKKEVETVEALQQRALHFLEEIAPRHVGNKVLIVTHGALMRSLLIRMLSLECTVYDICAENTCFLKISHCNNTWTVEGSKGIRLPSPTIL